MQFRKYDAEKQFSAVRGFQVYKMSWKPEEAEILESLNEENNPYDDFSIKVCKSNNAQSNNDGGPSSNGDIKDY